MKQIPSIFVEDEEYNKLKKIKEEKNYTWKMLLLSTINNDD